jgi:hypothetical protein
MDPYWHLREHIMLRETHRLMRVDLLRLKLSVQLTSDPSEAAVDTYNTLADLLEPWRDNQAVTDGRTIKMSTFDDMAERWQSLFGRFDDPRVVEELARHSSSATAKASAAPASLALKTYA